MSKKESSFKSTVSLAVAIIGMWASREYFLSQHIADLQKQLAEVQQKHALSEVSQIQLQYQLKLHLNQHDVIQTYIDSLPFPAWIKRQDADGKFRMVMINRAYESLFDVRKARYEGATDFEVWPKELAEQYQAHDLEVMKSKDYHQARELVIVDGREKYMMLWKFSIRLSDGRYGVGGIITDA